MLEKEEDGTQEEDTNADANPDTAEVEAAFLLLMKWLHRQPSFSPESMREPEVQEFVKKTAEVLNRAVDVSLEEIPLEDISVQRLKESNYVFSGIKTFHELNEAFPSLTNGEGNLKPFEHFLNDVQKVNENYNRHYLSAEYHFARASAQMAAKWQSFQNDPDRDRYLLQYRTAADGRVRKSHRLLHNITLPVTSRFWDWYFPPNGWRCRCNVVQVRRGKYPETGEQEAMNLGSQATAGKHQEMFRFNPGKQMATFPACNAYTISKCQNCKENGTLELAAKIPDNELCAACRVVREMAKRQNELKGQREEIRQWAKENLAGKTVEVPGIGSPVGFNVTGVKEALNQPHKYISEKNEAVRNILSLLQEGEHVLTRTDDKGNPMVKQYHYIRIKIKEEDSYAVIRELVNGECNFYSLVEKLKKKKG